MDQDLLTISDNNQIHQFKNNNYLALRGKKSFSNKQITRYIRI